MVRSIMVRSIRRYIVLILGVLGWSVSYIQRFIIPPIIPVIIEELGITHTEAGLLMTAFLVPYALMQIPSGVIGDVFGYKRVIVIGIIGMSVSTILMGLSNSLIQMLIARIAFGFFAGTYFAPCTSIIIDYFEGKGKAIGVFFAGAPLGAFAATVMTSLLLHSLNWRGIIILAATFGFPIALFFLICVKEKHKVSKANREAFLTKGKIKDILTLNILAISVAFLLYQVPFWGVQTFMVDFLVFSKNLEVVSANFVYTILPIAGIVGSLSGGLLSDIIGKLRSSVLLLTLIFAILLLLMLLPLSPAYIMLLAILGLAIYAPASPILALASDLINPKYRGTALGFINFCGFIGGSLATFLGGLIIDYLGYFPLFTFYSLSGLAAGILLLINFKLHR